MSVVLVESKYLSSTSLISFKPGRTKYTQTRELRIEDPTLDHNPTWHASGSPLKHYMYVHGNRARPPKRYSVSHQTMAHEGYVARPNTMMPSAYYLCLHQLDLSSTLYSRNPWRVKFSYPGNE